MTKPKKQHKRRKGQSASKAMLERRSLDHLRTDFLRIANVHPETDCSLEEVAEYVIKTDRRYRMTVGCELLIRVMLRHIGFASSSNDGANPRRHET